MNGIKYTLIVLVFAFASLIFVGKDTKAATTYISNPKITQLSRNGYRVSVTINNRNFSSIQFPSWTVYEGQDDLIWHNAVISGNTAYFDVKSSDHKNEFGQYITHIYVWDSNHKSLQTMNALNGGNPIIVPTTYDPKKVQTYNNHIYAVFNDYVTRSTAISKCEEMGGHLLTINDNYENDFICKMIKNDDVFNYWHVGGYKNTSTNTWEWITKEKYWYFNWDVSEPNSSYTGMAISKNGKMRSYSTSANGAGFILEIDASLKEVFNTRYKDRTYYLFDEITPREVARQYCKLHGGSLALITNKDESNKINQLIQVGTRQAYFFGMKRKGSLWYLDNGKRSTFFNWLSSQPDNYRGYQSCARIYRADKAWDDEFPYSINSGFIMEIRDKVKSNVSKKKTSFSKKIPRGKIKKIKKKSRGRVKIKWKKFKKYSGYILQICRKKKFKKKVIQRYFKRKQTSILVPLKKRRKYYVRVRVYKKKKNNQIFGRWSKVKKIKL